MTHEGIGQAVDEAPLTRGHWVVTVLAALGSFIDGYDLFIISVALLFIVPQWHLTPAQTGLLGSALLVGSFLGSIVFGRVADRVGRRAVFMIDLLSFVVFGILTAVAQNFEQLLIFRFLMGVGIGADMPTSTVLIAESAPRRHRGQLTENMVVFWFAGSLISTLVGLAFVAGGVGGPAWRWMLASGVVPAIILLLLRRTVPETPRWLATQARQQEASAVLTELGIPATGGPPPRVAPSSSAASLLRRPYLGRMLFLGLGWLFLGIPATGAFLYTPTILHGLGLTSKLASVEYAAGADALYVVTAFIVAWWLMEHWGRRPILITFTLVSGLAWLALALIGVHQAILVTILVAIAGATNLAAGSGFWVLSAEVFPTDIRGVGSGAVIAGGRAGGVLSTLIFPVLIAALGLTATSVVLGVILVALSGACALWARETAQRGLEEVAVGRVETAGMKGGEG